MNNEIRVSVVLPCLNEEAGLGICIKKIQDAFAQSKIAGEIVVSDNGSTDRSAEIARSLGAVVVSEPVRGYGAAYLRGLREARGRYIVMADADNTYDFYDIPKFVEALESGCDFVMGSRFKGKMEKGAMSWSHRYIGNPILSCMTRLFFHTKLSDIHCGMRAFTNEAYRKMKLRTLGMEFATEMVVSAMAAGLRIGEIPITYHPREGESKLKPFYDAWRHMRFMFLYSPVWLYFVPGLAGMAVGSFILVALLNGPILFLGHYWDTHLMVLASGICMLSFQVLNLGVYAHTFAIREGFINPDKVTGFFQRLFTLEKGLALGAAIALTGFVMLLFISIEWFSRNFGPLFRIRESIFAITLLIIGIQTMFSSFFISLLFLERK